MNTDTFHTTGSVLSSPAHRCQYPVISAIVSLLFANTDQLCPPGGYKFKTNADVETEAK
jgi:hypothetical protein